MRGSKGIAGDVLRVPEAAPANRGARVIRTTRDSPWEAM